MSEGNSDESPLSAHLITIDGTSGSGKSTLGVALVEALGGAMLDTGAYYRVAALAVGELWNGEGDLSTQATEIAIAALHKFEALPYLRGNAVNPEQVCGIWNGDYVYEQELQTPKALRYLSAVAALPTVRTEAIKGMRHLSDLLLQAGVSPVIAVGRDCGTVVWPEAKIKFYLDAPVVERQKRRERQHQGSVDNLLQRDRADQQRTIAPLQRAADAYSIETHPHDAQRVLEMALEYIKINCINEIPLID